MTKHTQPDIDCPSCGSAFEIEENQPFVSCPVCNGQFVLAGHLCPSCSAYHDEERTVCEECANPLVRLCTHCQTVNWTGHDQCISCGGSIDLLGQLTTTAVQSDADRLARQMSDAADLKKSEAEASDKRMAELMAIEEARQAELILQRVKRQRQERRMLIIVFAAVLLFLLGMIGFALLSGS